MKITAASLLELTHSAKILRARRREGLRADAPAVSARASGEREI
ncbi:hypothetical protein Rhow_005521 [Rhodococcus wratislaviensis]|uniref:Uncharacterized protein n=1 Tax=Rhodococcus wratislaviensis TaxID=44752 RepID=A0A402CE49_RHOWR|nr:hypothetical protein Rhow_005521 [Rhodococcus wratislaviensis]